MYVHSQDGSEGKDALPKPMDLSSIPETHMVERNN